MSDDQPGWDELAASWDEQPAAHVYAELAFDSLLAILAARDRSLDGADVLDFGCGTGPLVEHLTERCASIDAVDASQPMLDVVEAKVAAAGWTNIRTATAVSDDPNRYDLVVASSVCAFLDDYPSTVRRIAGTMRPGAVFVQWDWELDPADADPHGLRRSDIVDALTAAGFVDVEVASAFQLDMVGTVLQPLIGVGTAPD